MDSRDEQLDVQRIETVYVKRRTDATGREQYRHVLTTEWEVVPSE